MALRTAGSVLVVFLWSVAGVLGQYTVRGVCALKGSSVDLRCPIPSVTQVTEMVWYKTWLNGKPYDLRRDPNYEGRVEYHGTTEKDCILRITDLRQRDITTYYFIYKTNQYSEWKYGSYGFPLSLTDLKVERIYYNKLTCKTTCTLTGNPTYIWYKNGQHLDESTTPQYKDPVSSNYEDSISCAVKGHENLRSPAVCVDGQSCSRVTYTKRRICVLKGSTVDISCTYVGYYSTTSTFWFRSDKSIAEDLTTDPGYAGRVEYTGTYRGPFTLKITDLREEDSAEYRFTFKTNYFEWGHSFPGTTLTVTGLQVKVTPAAEGQRTLTCRTTCTLTDNPTYIWYKNGHKVKEDTSSLYPDYFSDADSYSCAVKGHEDLHSPAVCQCGLNPDKACIQGQDCNRVTYNKRRICVLKGSTVDISCTYDSGYDTVTSSLWFSPKQSDSWKDELIPEDLTTDPGYAGRVEYVGEKERGRSTLRITDLREEDSAEYKFIFNTQTSRWGYSFPGTSLTVTDLQVKVTPATEAGKRTLTCSATCTLTDNPTYIWYKNGHKVKEDTSSLYSDSFSDADSYSCAVKGHEDLHSPAVCQKCWSVTYTHQKICALKGSTVNISCSYTYPSYHEIKKAFWFTKWSGMDTEDLSSMPGYEGHIEYLGDKESNCTLRITDLRLSDSAGYRFRFITSGGKFSGSPVSLTVTDVVLKMGPTSVSEGERVTLTCRTKCTLDPITAYSWYKNGQPIPNSNTYSPVYSLFSVSSEDTGRYSCAVEGREDLPSAEEALTVRYGPRNTSVSVSPSGEIVEGSSVTLTCSSDANPPVQSYTWRYKKNGGEYQSMTGPQHVFSQIQSSDTGEYYCESQNEMGTDRSRTINMDVKYDPKSTSVSVSPSGEIVEGSSVTLTCSSDANPPVDKYTWYKKNGASLTGSEKTYNFTTINSEDSGEYYCEAENKYGRLNSSSVSVDVQYGPKNTSVSVSPSGGIVEGSSVTLTCSSDANPPVDKYTWYLQNETFLNGFGKIYNISKFKSKDNGHYHCEAQNGRGSRNSTALMIILPGKQTVLTAAVGIIVVVLVLILSLSGLMWFRKKASKSPSDTRDTSENVQGDSSPVYDNISNMVMTSTAAQTAATDDQDDVHYASVHFSRSKIQEVPLYSTVQLPQPQKQDEDVQYDVVKFNWLSNSNRPTAAQAAEEDSSEIYSRVNKPRRPEHNKPRRPEHNNPRTQKT